MPSLHIDKISLSSFKATLSRYADTRPSTLSELDTLRYDTVPAKLAKIKEDASLQKSDVEKLVEWKLKHGTYRPTLMSLVKQNPADLVKATTQEAYTSYATSTDALKALKILTKLRGIGPATASLLLSVYQPGTVPFFSDEVFRWTHWDEQGKTGWGRSIKYCVKEYGEVIARVERVRERLGVRAVDVERVAYVLGKEGLDVDAEIEGEREDDGVGGRVSEKIAGENVEESSAENKGNVSEAAAAAIGNGEDKEEERGPKAAKKGAKRKAQDAKIPAEGTRKSTRRKL